MKATRDPSQGTITLLLTAEEWLMLPHWSTPMELLSAEEETALRALLRTLDTPEGYEGP